MARGGRLSAFSFQLSAFPPRLWFILISALLLGEVASWAWRIVSDRASFSGGPDRVLTFQIPESERASYRPLEILPRQVRQLLYDQGARYQRDFASGERLEVMLLSYDKGNPNLTNDMYVHDPTICMPAAGATVEDVIPSRTESVSGDQILRIWCVRLKTEGQRKAFAYKVTWFPVGHEWLPPGRDRFLRIQRAFTLDTLPPALLISALIQGVKDQEQADQILREAVIAHLKLVPAKQESKRPNNGKARLEAGRRRGGSAWLQCEVVRPAQEGSDDSNLPFQLSDEGHYPGWWIRHALVSRDEGSEQAVASCL